MNNGVNSNQIPRLKSSLILRTTVPFRHESEKAGLLGSDKPRVLHMSATLRRMLKEVDVARHNSKDETARA